MNSKLHALIRQTRRYFAGQRRDSRYVFVFLIGSIILLLSTLQALSQGLFDSVERPIFQAINNLPGWLHDPMFAFTQFGGLGSLVFWAGLAWYVINRRAALTVAASGFTAWFLAKFVKAVVERGRPGSFIDSINLFNGEIFGGYGFPSGHATFSAACATVLYYQVPKRYRKYLLLVVLLVGLSRIYLGAHFPLDVVGGWALGAVVGSAMALVFGMSNKGLTAQKIKAVLNKKGYEITTLHFANVDARGSRPVFLTDKKGVEYFGKIFGVQEHAADWLFKIYRFFRYKNLQGEEPYINSRRNIELESFATMWANQAGVRVPVILDLVRIGSSWMLIQQKLDAVALADHKRVKQATLIDTWEQVKCLHAANTAHRDLRAANIMVDKKGHAWLIDFGFAEVAPNKQRQYMDIAELLMSMTLVAGVNRTIDSVTEVIDREVLIKVLPYLKREVFSGDTSKKMKQNKQLLDEVKQALVERLGVKTEIDEADIIRINFKKILNVVLIGLFLYIVIPQFNLFKGAFQSLTSLDVGWLLPLAIGSALTYVATAVVYMALATVPLRLWPTTLVQLAASFMSKIIPGGVGSTGVNARYLHRAGMDSAESAAVLTTQGIIGFVMFALPLSLFLLIRGQSLSSLLSFHITPREIIAALCIMVLAAAVLALYKTIRQKVLHFVSNFATSIREFSNSPREIALAAGASLAVSLCYVFCMYVCLRAFDVSLGFTGAIFVYASAVIARSAVPTPGGLGPLEIAMVSSMIGLGVAKPEAVSVVVLYRLATFWLPVPFSVLAYRYITRQKYI
jgi:glycosyltransferase 2 family protein